MNTIKTIKTEKLIWHESTGLYSDRHSLHIITGVATEEQLRESLIQTIETYNKTVKPSERIITDIIISMVADKDGSPCGYAYVWVTDSKLYFILTGRNPDGSERYMIVHDESQESGDVEFDDVDDDFWERDRGITSWSDHMDLVVPQPRKIQLEPLMELSPCVLTIAQRLALRTNEDTYEFRCTPTLVSDPESKYQPNVLCGMVAADVTVKDLKTLFLPFVSNTQNVHYHRINGNVTEDKFPLVSLTNARDNMKRAFITFDPSTHDSEFAAKVTHKITLVKNMGNRDKVYNLMFMRAYKKV